MKSIFIIVFVLFFSVVNATSYFIDPSGSDANNGSAGSPWKTLAYACSRVNTPGDIIHVNAGTFTETVQSLLAVGVSIEGEGVNSIITSLISKEYISTILLYSTAEGTSGNQHISNVKFDGSSFTAYSAIHVVARSNVSIYDCSFVNFNKKCVMYSGSTNSGSEPNTYAAGNKFYNNIVTDCSNYISGCCGYGSLELTGQEGFLAHDNIISATGRPTGSNGSGITAHYTKGLKAYNNTITCDPAIGEEMGNNNAYTFSFELWEGRGGTEIYNNNIYNGTIDIAGNFEEKGTYDYSVSVHDNFIGRTALTTHDKIGIIIEGNLRIKDILIYNNLIKYVNVGIAFYPTASAEYSNIYIYYNIFDQIGIDYTGSLHTFGIWGHNSQSNPSYTVNNFHVLNNVFNASTRVGNIQGAAMNLFNKANCTVTNLFIRNNIFKGWDQAPIYGDAGGTIDYLWIENNIFYQNANNNNPLLNITPTHYTLNNPGTLKADPLFVSSSDFHLQPGSPAIGKGLKITGITTDYDGNSVNDPPCIGAYENLLPSNPLYQNSVIENLSPSILDLTYDQNLANIIPATSAFSVSVNSANRPVSSVNIAGSKVRLTLSSAIVYGDIITVSYTSPLTNPLQTASGGKAENLISKSVTNNCASNIPTYNNSVVENATPSILDLSYDLSLANIVPATSSFYVQVNSAGRTVNSVEILGNKVRLTLAGAIVSGDIVNVSYTTPAANPLQTISGGKAASLIAKPVTNNCLSPVPVYAGAVVENAAPSILEMTYSLNLANIVPLPSAFSVRVNSTDRPVASVTIAGTKVRLTLASPIVFSDIVSVAYTKPASNPLQSLSGEMALSISARTVTNNCISPVPVYAASVIENATPATLTITYNLNLANTVPSASAFTVQVNSAGRAVSSVAIIAGKVQLTLSSAVISGDLVTVAYTRPSLNPLQTASGGIAESISAKPVTNNIISPVPVLSSSIVENVTPSILEMTYNLSLANTLPATTAFSVLVNSVGRSVISVAITGSKVRLTLANPIVYGDLVILGYAKPASNPLKTAAGGEAANITGQLVTNNCAPVIPVYISSVVQNATPTVLELIYDLNLSSIIPDPSAFTVLVNSVSRSVISVSVSGNKVFLTLASAIVFGDVVTVAYSKPATKSLTSLIGGQAASMPAKVVTNNCLVTLADQPTIVVKNASGSFSGFVGEIDASGSYGFNNDILTYEWIVPDNIPVSSTNSPKIKYLSPAVTASKVVVFQLKINNGKTSKTANIPINILPYKPELDIARIADTEASSYQSPDYPNNVTDGNPATKWSVTGDNQWLLLKLAESFKISHLDIAFLQGQKYNSYFDIYASLDNFNWEPILLNAVSCNFSGERQVFDFPVAKTNSEYSYIKLIGHGSSLSTLNIISEFKVFGLQQRNRSTGESGKIKVVIYPNPARDFFNISIEEPDIKPDMIRLIDLSGTVLFEALLNDDIKKIQIPGNIMPGMYIVELRSGNLILDTQKLIINR
jgi:uncharacterized repeat protein (TIGR02059 family)